MAYEDRRKAGLKLKLRPGRPKKLAEREERYIIRFSKKDRAIRWASLCGAIYVDGTRINKSTMKCIIKRH